MNIRRIKNESYMTLIFLTIQTIIFVLMQSGLFGSGESATTVINFGGLYGLQVLEDPTKIWHLISPIFVHIGFSHFIFNSIVLYFLGKQTEEVFGHLKFSLIYLGSGLLGNCLTFFFDTYSISAGASGGLLGLFGAFIVLRFLVPNNGMIQGLSQSYFMLMILTLVSSVIQPNIAFWGHLGGLIGGALLTVVLGASQINQKFNKHLRIVSGIFYIFLIFSTIFLTFANFS
ncbi:MAG: rhomboid family intramembrane serine protease [Streptococcaceae bacterium]|jgi:rhomboid protease GluP|nr:rhomboid family intramembrane serine protease [Streptococcaceae bacterium]MCH4177010.1 rhomboid family intramembrane serine protease [Streptococcaceae bacterium]